MAGLARAEECFKKPNFIFYIFRFTEKPPGRDNGLLKGDKSGHQRGQGEDKALCSLGDKRAVR